MFDFAPYKAEYRAALQRLSDAKAAEDTDGFNSACIAVEQVYLAMVRAYKEWKDADTRGL